MKYEHNVVVGGVYKHFKGNMYEVICIGKNTETEEDMVIYKPYGSDGGTVWVRPFSSFISLVDNNKYPNVEQEYRFEYIGVNNGGN